MVLCYVDNSQSVYKMKIKDSDIIDMYYQLSKPLGGFLVPSKFARQLLRRANQTEEYVDLIYARYERRYKWRLRFQTLCNALQNLFRRLKW